MKHLTSLDKSLLVLAFGAISFGSFASSDTLQIQISTSSYNGYNISCYGASDGSIHITPINGTPPYVYEWSYGNGDSTNENISGLPANTYHVYVHPNPTQDVAKLVYYIEGDGIFEIYNAVGEMQSVQKLQSTVHEFVFDAFSLINGVYYFKVICCGQNVNIGKFVVAR